MTKQRHVNPFAITKAVDLNDEQIERLWVKIVGDNGDLPDLDHPTSPMPSFILGAKGSGKTHLMRHQAFELQKLRYQQSGLTLRAGVEADRYLGLYVRCSGLQSSRFAGKRQSAEVWHELFSFYFELWLSQHLLYVVRDLGVGVEDGDEAELVGELLAQFDRKLDLSELSISALIIALEDQQRLLDYEINNCLLKGSLTVEVVATRGKLIFGFPRVLSKRYAFLKDVLFSFDVDEFENLTESQQVHVNTLVREKEPPTTFRIGARTYGIRTHRTNSGGEENLRDSEYSEIQLDVHFRENKTRYDTFVKLLIGKRLSVGSGITAEHAAQSLERCFEVFENSFSSKAWLEVVGKAPVQDRPHFKRLKEIVAGHGYSADVFEYALQELGDIDRPLREKLNLLLLYQEVGRGTKFPESVAKVASKQALNDKGEPVEQSYRQALQHYGEDLAAQLLRENNRSVWYCGLSTFTQMSAGIPRALLTVLRSIYEWAVFHDERPFESGSLISLRSQQRGVLEASNWYYHNMRKAGDDGLAIQTAVDRLSNILRVHRFGDKPTESALSSFSVVEQEGSDEARRVLKLCEARAFLHRVPGGQKDKNSENIQSKFQLSPMLAPRWDLPLVRRGAIPLRIEEFNAIFGGSKSIDAFTEVEKKHRARVTSPFRASAVDDSAQLGLF